MRTILTAALFLAAPATAAPKAADPGATVYREVCQACHMANGQGAEGAGRITSLARNPNLADAGYPIGVVTGGRGAMPWFRGDLTDQQIADAVTYIRKAFGNKYKGKTTPAEIAQLGIPAPNGSDR